jgi:hypothetical protein
MTAIDLDSENISVQDVHGKIDLVRDCLDNNRLDPLVNFTSRTFSLGERGLKLVPLPGTEVVFTTYFCGKPDPQRNTFVEGDAYDYIKPLYESVRDLGLSCIIFHDGLSRQFTDRYTTESIKFVRAQLGGLSLNDERYFLYYEYLLRFGQHFRQVILSDVSDVVFRDNPFSLLRRHPRHLFTGRSSIDLVKYSFINYKRIRKFEKDAGLSIPDNFYNMRIFNAGTIGGSKEVVTYLLRQMVSYLLSYSTDRNHNMTVFNLCVYRFWLEAPKLPALNMISLRYALLKVIVLLENKTGRDLLPAKYYCDNETYETEAVFAGYPFTSAFKQYETNSKAYLIHK